METNIVKGPWSVLHENTIKFPATSDDPDWVHDLHTYTRLIGRFAYFAKLQKMIITHLKKIDQASDTNTKSNNSLPELPADVHARIAVRAGLAKLQNTHRKARTTSEILTEEAAYLSKSLISKRTELLRLEDQILSAIPKNEGEAKLLLTYVSKLVGMGRTIEGLRLADVLANCASALPNPANTTPKNSASG